MRSYTLHEFVYSTCKHSMQRACGEFEQLPYSNEVLCSVPRMGFMFQSNDLRPLSWFQIHQPYMHHGSRAAWPMKSHICSSSTYIVSIYTRIVIRYPLKCIMIFCFSALMSSFDSIQFNSDTRRGSLSAKNKWAAELIGSLGRIPRLLIQEQHIKVWGRAARSAIFGAENIFFRELRVRRRVHGYCYGHRIHVTRIQ